MMEDLNSTLNSILSDPSKMEQLRQVAQSLGMNPEAGASPPQAAGAPPAPPPPAQTAPPSGGANLGALSKLTEMMSAYNQSDKNVELLRTLRPHFSQARAGRIDDAIHIMQLIRVWPALRDSGLLGNLGSLLGGGGKK